MNFLLHILAAVPILYLALGIVLSTILHKRAKGNPPPSYFIWGFILGVFISPFFIIRAGLNDVEVGFDERIER